MHYECHVTKTMSAVSMDGRQPAVAPDKISTLQEVDACQHDIIANVAFSQCQRNRLETSCCSKVASVILQRRITVRMYCARVIGERRCCTAIQMSNFGIRN